MASGNGDIYVYAGVTRWGGGPHSHKNKRAVAR